MDEGVGGRPGRRQRVQPRHSDGLLDEPTRKGSHNRQNAPYRRMQTKDGYLMVGAAGEAISARCAKALATGRDTAWPHAH
jgi:hypothetical protein